MRIIRRILAIVLVALGAIGAVNDLRDFLAFEWMYRNVWVNIQNLAFCAVWALLILTGLRMWRMPATTTPANH
jgi:hypothetical protein